MLGFERMEYELTSDAIASGLDAALPAVFELRGQIGEFGRGERSQARDNQLIVEIAGQRVVVTMRLAELPQPFDWLRSA